MREKYPWRQRIREVERLRVGRPRRQQVVLGEKKSEKRRKMKVGDYKRQ